MIEVAQRGDVPVLCDMFLGHISANSEYISHGEIQMGVGVGRFVDGEFVTSVAPAAREQWLKYINGKIDSADAAVVFKAVSQGVIVGFCVVEITDDGAEPFGMVCDVLVNGECRKSGIGSLLDGKYTENNCKKVVEVRDWTEKQLKKLGFSMTDSKANFIFATHPKADGKEIYLRLKQKGVLIRHFDTERLFAYNRITVGSKKQMQIFIMKLKEVLEEII